MNTIFLTIAQLTLVALVYYFAYKKGYEHAQTKASAILKEFSSPINDAMARLERDVEKHLESENEK